MAIQNTQFAAYERGHTATKAVRIWTSFLFEREVFRNLPISISKIARIKGLPHPLLVEFDENRLCQFCRGRTQ